MFFFFNDTATTEIYTLSLHDALPICHAGLGCRRERRQRCVGVARREHSRNERHAERAHYLPRSEEHTSELQSQSNLVCRLLLEKKKNRSHYTTTHTDKAVTSAPAHAT